MKRGIIGAVSILIAMVLLVFKTDGAYGQIIDPHPACSGSNSACWPTRKVSQHSCSDCKKGWFCFGNTNISCEDPIYGGGSSALCGGAGPCMNLCDSTIPNNYPRCNVFDANVICNEVTASTCRWRDIVTDCSIDVVNQRCNLTSRVQTLSCCGPGSVATATSTPPPSTATPTTPPASCSISINGISLNGVGDTTNVPVIVLSETGGFVTSIVISGSSLAAVTPNPDSDKSDGFNFTFTSIGVGPPETITATATMNTGTTCVDTATLVVTEVGAWWQIKEGYGVTNGSIRSLIPASCSGSCDPVFITHDLGGFPGVPTYLGSFGTGTVSSTGWLARSRYSSPVDQDYKYFEKRIPSGASLTSISSASEITTAGVDYDGYVWLRYDSASGDPFVISDDINLGNRKVVLFVDGASVRIEGNINLNDGLGFFLLISDKNIFIDPGVGGGLGPNLEGLYFADQQIMTGADDKQLVVRGSLVGLGDQGGTYHINQGIVFERDLVDNSQTPAEFIEYAPDQALLFPPELGIRNIIWKEVAP